MTDPSAYQGRVSPRALNIVFWGLFLAIGGAAFYLAPDLGYDYSAELSLTTYTTVVQGVGVLLAIAGATLLFLKVKLDAAVSSLEDRTLGVLNNRLGWSVIKWSEELEYRLQDEFRGAATAYSPETPEVDAANEDYLEKELDDLLDAILMEEGGGGGTTQVQQQVTYEEQRAALSTDIREVIAAVRERRGLVARRSNLVRTLVGPLAMLGALLAMAAWAIPASAAFLGGQPALNTTLLFLSTYGGVVALVFTAVAGFKAASG